MFSTRFAAAGSIALFAGLGLVACTQAPSADVGDCLNSESLTEGDEVTSLPTVSCDEAHDAEVFFSYDLEEGDFPGLEAITESAEERCVAAFSDYVGIDYEESELWANFIYPQEEVWEKADDREVLCFAISDEPVTESFKDSQI